MSLIRNIAATYRSPIRATARILAGGAREDRILALLMGACAAIFVAQWPRLSRQAFETGEDLQMLMGNALFSMVFLLPLVLYGLAALSHLAARAAGGRGSFARARLALAWALVASMPVYLLWGLLAGFLGPGPGEDMVGLISLVVFVIFWGAGLKAAEWGAGTEGTV